MVELLAMMASYSACLLALVTSSAWRSSLDQKLPCDEYFCMQRLVCAHEIVCLMCFLRASPTKPDLETFDGHRPHHLWTCNYDLPRGMVCHGWICHDMQVPAHAGHGQAWQAGHRQQYSWQPWQCVPSHAYHGKLYYMDDM